MKWAVLPLLLTSLLGGISGCESVPANLAQKVRATEIVQVARFNHLRRQNMPIPEIVFTTLSDADGEVDGANSPILIDPAKCQANLSDCLYDTLPHEEAHWALYYYGYYRDMPIMGPMGVSYKENVLPHDGIWCDTMRAFGGHPRKHGYCQR